MQKEYNGFTKEEKQKFIDAYIANIDEINKGLSDEKKLVPNIKQLEERLNDPKEVKIYKLSKEINEKSKKYDQEKTRIENTYGENKNDFLYRTFSYLLKPGDTEEERNYNDNLYKEYLENPYKVFQESLKDTLSINPSKYFEAVQNGDLEGQLEFIDENLGKLKSAFTFINNITDKADKIQITGEHSGGIMLSEEFKRIYKPLFNSIILIGNETRKAEVTALDEYFTVPPVKDFMDDKMDVSKVNMDLMKKIYNLERFGGNDNIIKTLNNHKEIKVDDNFFVSYKAIKVVEGEEVEIPLQTALSNDEGVKFVKRSKDEIDTLLNPIDKDYLKVLNGELTQEEYNKIELEKFIEETEDFVKNPSKYHKEKYPDFTIPFTEEEKKGFEERYIKNVEEFNKALPDDKKIELNLDELHNKLIDPKQVEIYRRAIYLKEKEQKQVKILNQYKDILKNNNKMHPLSRAVQYFLRTDGSDESRNYNLRFLRLYSKYPAEITQATLKGFYNSDLSVYNAILQNDYERSKYYFDNFEHAKIAFEYSNIFSSMKADDGGLVEEFKNTNLSTLIQTQQSLGSDFAKPETIFEIPNLTSEQAVTCANYCSKEYSDLASWTQHRTIIEQHKEELKILKETGIFDSKDSLLSIKAVEIKDDIEKEVKIDDVIKKGSNIKFVKRSDDEIEKMLQISNGIRRRENLAKIERVSTKDSMAIHYDAIRNYMLFASHANNGEEYKFEKAYDANLGLKCINDAIDYINDNSKEWFEKPEVLSRLATICGFKVKDNKILRFDKRIIGNKDLEKIDIDFFNQIELMITDEQILKFREEVKGIGNYGRNRKHVLDEKTKELKSDIPGNLSQEEKDEYIKALDNINAKVFIKTDDAFMEDVIDGDSTISKTLAKNNLGKFVENFDISEEDKKVFLRREIAPEKVNIKFDIQNAEQYKSFANVYEKAPRIEFSEELKNKIKGLHNIVEETGIFKVFVTGESQSKSYGFTTFFDKQKELNELIKKDTSKLSEEDKKKYALEVIKKSNELNDLEAKYDKVLDYIKTNFDMDKVSMNQNIYSGRATLETVRGLLEKWDDKNAHPGVILNGLAQLYGTTKDAGVTIDQFLDDPEGALRKFIENKAKDLKDKFFIPKEGNSLGKRLARASNYDKDKFYGLPSYIFAMSRAPEFVIQLDTDRERAVRNMQSDSLYEKGLEELTVGPMNYLQIDPYAMKPITNYDNLINIMMFGDQFDNIFSPCENFYNTDFKRAYIPNYMDKYKKMMENPGETFNKITETIKDFILERQKILNEVDKMDENTIYSEVLYPKNVAVAGKVMIENMLLANNKTLKDIADPTLRNNIQEFLKNPVKALNNIYPNQLGMTNEELEAFEEKTQEAIGLRINALQESFIDTMKKEKKEVENENGKIGMYKVLDEHKIGFFEGIFSTKSTRLYRKLVNSLNGAVDMKNSKYGKVGEVAKAAKAYLDYKYKDGKTIDDLQGEAKERAKFCEDILKAYKISYKTEADFVLNNKTLVTKNLTNEEKAKEVNNNLDKENIVEEKKIERIQVLTAEAVNIEKGNNTAKKDKPIEKIKEDISIKKDNDNIQKVN